MSGSVALAWWIVALAAAVAHAEVPRLTGDVWPGPVGGLPFAIAAIAKDSVVFDADDGVHGRELWASDGRSASAFLVLDIRPGPDPSAPSRFQRCGDVVYFGADDGIHGIELWTTNGTVAGTRLVADIADGLFSSQPRPSACLGERVAFMTEINGEGRELWISDGTESGTVLVRDLYPGLSSGLRSLPVTFEDNLYFDGATPGGGVELWRSDGSHDGTTRVLDLVPGGAGQPLARFAPAPGVLYFRGDGQGGLEPWRTDGTSAGTMQIKDIHAGFVGSLHPGVTDPLLVLDDGRFFFGANRPGVGTEPWISDGTDAGTAMLADLLPGTVGSMGTIPLPRGETNGESILFVADDGVHGRGPWIYDLASEALHRLDINPATGAGTRAIAVVRPFFFFDASDGSHGRELWRSDGTPEGTTLIADLSPTPGGSFPRTFGVSGRTLFFVAEDGVHGPELWALSVPPAPVAPVIPTLGRGGGLLLALLLSGAAVLSLRRLGAGPEIWFPHDCTRVVEIRAAPMRLRPEGGARCGSVAKLIAFIHARSLTAYVTHRGNPGSGLAVADREKGQAP